MASVRSGNKAPVGSAKWVYDERQQARHFVEQEVEEFAFSARNELEWLNEHMSDIFSRNQFDVADVFKTPGKLRGKTPRTARKHTPGRAPLTDIFATNSPAKTRSPAANGFYKKITQFQVAEDKENPQPLDARSPPKINSAPIRDVNADSGYHDMSDDDQENEKPASPAKQAPALPARSPDRTANPLVASPPRPRPLKQVQASQKDSDSSFHSAREVPTAVTAEDTARHDADVTMDQEEPDEMQEPAQRAIVPSGLQQRTSNQYSVSDTTADGLGSALEEVERTAPLELQKSRSSSETSSPERPALRKKSSLTFATLPARDPLSLKMSMGARASQARGSIRGAPTLNEKQFVKSGPGPKSNHEQDQGTKMPVEPPNTEDFSTGRDVQADTSKLHNKTSTQRLHERITMLGQMKQGRPSKSIPSVAATTQSQTTQESQAVRQQKGDNNTTDEADDDWIAPISGRTTQSSQTMPGSFSTTSGQWMNQTQESTLIEPVALETQSLAQKEQAVSQPYPKLPVPADDSTTPAGSPVNLRWQVDGPLSASKAKFSSFLKSAKGMFASSAAASAQAKVETLSPGRSRAKVDFEHTDLFQAPSHPKQPTVNASNFEADAKVDEAQSDLRDALPAQGASKRRSSQRLRDQKAASETNFDEAMGVDADVDADDKQMVSDGEQDDEKSAAPASHNKHSQRVNVPEHGSNLAQKKPKAFLGQASQSGELRRPNKVTKTQAGPAKGSFSIRVPSQKTTATLSASTLGGMNAQEPTSHSNAPKRPTLVKKGSSSSLRSTSTTQTAKSTATSSSRLKVLDNAAKMKEKEERERQRKADEKRERERKRAQAEEEKKRQQLERQAAEQQREREEQEARNAAQNKRAEAQRRNEQLRQQAEAARSLAQAQQQEVSTKPRPAPRLVNDDQAAANVRPHVNPAKPKRYFQPDGDDERQAPTRLGGAQEPPHFVTANNGAKRRKTNDEDVAAPRPSTNNTRPTMAPPMRPSINRKQELPSKFTQGFMSSTSAPQQPGQPPSMLKTAVTTNHQISHGGPKTPHAMTELAKFSNARIPFAGAPNPPSQQHHGAQHQSYAQKPSQHLKTPGTAHKSSPQYPAGESISLPEIVTDSEDSDADDDDGFVAPAWANSPELRALLAQQQLRDPREVFGPIAPLAMEEVFKGGSRERTARFRNRTSSANWGGADRLTEEERRRDREAREKLEREGGWSFGADV